MDQKFKEKIIAIRGDKGKKWLDKIPELIMCYEKEWEITCLPPFPLSYNYVAPAQTKDGRDVVLKILLPQSEKSYEADALRFFNGQGAIKLIKEDKKNSVLLLERALPGIQLHKEPGKQIDGFIDVVSQLHRPIFHDNEFPTLEIWAHDFVVYKNMFNLSRGPIPQRLFEKAEEIYTTYPKEKKQHVLLHGDLHSENILLSERGYVAIDPKGIIGEKEFEAGTFLRSPYTDFSDSLDIKNRTRNRIIEIAEKMQGDKKRVLDWAFATAINGLVWFLEDENSFKDIYLENAKLLDSISL